MSKGPPLRLRDDPSVARALRGDLARAANASVPYDVATGLASFEHALKGGAGAASAAATGAKTVLGAAIKGALLGVVMVGGAAVVESRAPSHEDPALAPAPRVVAARAAGNERAAPAPTLAETPPEAAPVASATPPVASARAHAAPVPALSSDALREGVAALAPRGDDAPAAAEAPPPPGTAGASAASGAPPGAGDPLAAELELVGRLRALGDGDPARSLALATEGNQRFPGGLFVQEREAIAIAALVRLGRVAEARARGRAFLAAYPRSSFAERIEKLVGGGGP